MDPNVFISEFSLGFFSENHSIPDCQNIGKNKPGLIKHNFDLPETTTDVLLS